MKRYGLLMTVRNFKIMKNVSLFCRVLLLTAALTVATHAGDYARFHFIGFSNSGRYLAFEEYGMIDEPEDGSPYAAIYIVDVDRNTLATAPVKTKHSIYPDGPLDGFEARVRLANRRRAARELRRFGIVEGNTGLQVVAHLINEYDTDYEENSEVRSDSEPVRATPVPPKDKTDPLSGYIAMLPQRVSFTKRGNALYRDGFYQIKINPVPVKQKNCDEDERDLFSFEMTLTNEEKKTRVLQPAGKIPASRGCVNGYGIQEAFIYKNRLAVFVGVFTRGWEGENMRLMAVTGFLDEQ